MSEAGSPDSININEGIVMNKYILAGMQMLSKGDAKTKSMLSYPALLKAQLRLNQAFGQGVILRCAFDKGNPISMLTQ